MSAVAPAITSAANAYENFYENENKSFLNIKQHGWQSVNRAAG